MRQVVKITTTPPDFPVSRDMTYGDMRRATANLPIIIASAELPGDLWGIYSDKDKAIIIDRRLTYTAKRCTLVHELIHWWHGDADCYMAAKVKHERRTRAETARLLVDAHEYALAERMYGGNSWLMAQELDVTTQVLDDYRELVLEK